MIRDEDMIHAVRNQLTVLDGMLDILLRNKQKDISDKAWARIHKARERIRDSGHDLKLALEE